MNCLEVETPWLLVYQLIGCVSFVQTPNQVPGVEVKAWATMRTT